MADKFRDSFPVAVTFAKGEQPSSDKYTGWAAQTNTGLQLMEKGLGNLWGDEVQVSNMTGDPYMIARQAKRTSQVANLAALIGPASSINPLRVSDRNWVNVTLNAGDIPLYVNEFTLPVPALMYGALGNDAFPAANVITCTLSGGTYIQDLLEGIGGTVFGVGQRQLTKEAVDAAGDYYIDAHGRVFTFSYTTATENTASGTYDTQLFWDSYDQATPNVMPDINETNPADLKFCTVVYDAANDQYTITLPNLRYFPGYEADGDPLLIDSANPSASLSPEDFQGMLPYTLTNQLTAGDIIPDGYIYLWDTEDADQTPAELAVTGGGIVEGLTYEFNTDFSFKVSGATLETTQPDRYRVITVGTTITELLADLRWRFNGHSHSTRRSGMPISHSSIGGSGMNPQAIAAYWGIDVTAPTSALLGNYHPQYLLRYGRASAMDPGNQDNAMLGPLMMGAGTGPYTAANSYLSTAMDSHCIYFGHTDIKLYRDYSAETGSGVDALSSKSAFCVGSETTTTTNLLMGNQAGGVTGLYWSGLGNYGFALRHDGSVAGARLQAGRIHVHDKTIPRVSFGTGQNYINLDANSDPLTTIYREASGTKMYFQVTATKAYIVTDDKIEISSEGGAGAVGIRLDAEAANSNIEIVATQAVNVSADTLRVLCTGGGGLVIPTTIPSVPEQGSMYYNNGLSTLRVYYSGSWVNI